MLTESSTQSQKFNISSIQKILFNILLFALPWFIVPLPWDITEKGKSLLVVGISTLIILLEVIKWIWDGKITILRSPLDSVVLVILISLILSTVLAMDTWVAMWGFDGKLGSGFFVTVFLLGTFYLYRNFLASKESLSRAVESLVWGIGVLSLLSLLSFFKVNIFSTIPLYKDFVTVGLPLTFSFSGMMILSAVSMFLITFLSLVYKNSKQYIRLWYLGMIFILSFITFVLFSINQGILLPLIFSLSMLFLAVLFMFKMDSKQRYVSITLIVVAILALVSSVAMQFGSFREAILGVDFEVLTPLVLGNNITWQISTSAITSDLVRGLTGLGNDSFGIAYSYYKPLTSESLSLGSTTFVYGYSEVLTLLATRGLLGVIAWILMGLAVIRMLIKDMEELSEKEELLYFVPEILMIFLLLVSLISPFSILISFIFFVSLLITVVARTLSKVNKEYFVIKFWAMDVGDVGKNLNKSISSINWFLTAIFIIIAGLFMVKVFSLTISSMYLLKAESYSYQENEKYTDIVPTIEEREQFLDTYLRYYDQALSFDKNNPLIQRKAGLISLEVLNLLSEKYSDASEEDKKEILTNVGAWKNTAIEFTREAVKISPYTYANWNARSAVYMGLVGVGLSDYSQDAVTALQRAIELNPIDYMAYYQIGQVYMVTEEYEKSLSAFNQALSINGQHVPSLVFGAQILSQQQETKSAISYLEAAKTILENNEQKESDLYKNVTDTLTKLKPEGTANATDEETP